MTGSVIFLKPNSGALVCPKAVSYTHLAYILERVNHYDKLYLEFGGKLVDDKHAKRVLPGFEEDAKIKLLQKLKDQAEILICVYAGDIERNKIRGDYGITYDMDILRLIDELRGYGLLLSLIHIS